MPTFWRSMVLIVAVPMTAMLTRATGGNSGSLPPLRHVCLVTPGEPLEPEYTDWARDFIAALRRKGLDAQAANPPAGGTWHQVPAVAPAEHCLLLAAVRTGGHVELLLFRPQPPGAGVSLVARQPASASAYRHVPASQRPATGPAQDLRWAGAYLAAQAADALRQSGPPGQTKPVQVMIDPPPQTDADAVAGIETLAFAAASQAGLLPRNTAADARLVVSASKVDVLYRLRVEWQEKGRQRFFACDPIPDQGLLATLSAAVKNVALWNGMVEKLAYVHPPPDALFGWQGSAFVFSAGGRIGSLAAGVVTWHTDAADAGKSDWTPRRGGGGELAVYRYRPRLEQISAFGQRERRLTERGSSHAWGFQFADNADWLAVCEGDELQLVEKERLLWTQRAATRFDCGPLIAGDKVVAGEENGVLHAFALQRSKQALWSVPLEQRLFGPLWHLPGSPDLIMAASLGGKLSAVSAADGRILWRAELEDRMTGEPVAVAGAVAVAAGAGGVMLLDRATGSLKGRWKPELPLKHFVSAGASAPRLACSDLAGNISFLSGLDLHPFRSMRIDGLACLVGMTNALPATPEGASFGLSPELVVAADRAGVIYFMPAEQLADSDVKP